MCFARVWWSTKLNYAYIHPDKIDPREEHGNMSCYASTINIVHSSDILFADYSISTSFLPIERFLCSYEAVEHIETP
jgi:hypothetical protein